MDVLLFVYALVVLSGMAVGIEDKSLGWLYILAVLLWPLTLIFITVDLIFDLL